MFNEISDRGQLTQLLQRRLNMLGAAPSPSLMPEIAPTIALENDRAEWGWYKGELRRARFTLMAAAAAQFNMVQAYIPTNRRNIAVVTKIVNHNASILNVARTFIGGGIVGWVGLTTGGRDLRDPSTGGAVLFENNTNILQPALGVQLGRLSSNSAIIDEPFVLAPTGQTLTIYNAVANQELSVSVYWYEREAFPGELG